MRSRVILLLLILPLAADEPAELPKSEMLAMGGMNPHEVLRTATTSGAATLGLAKDLGSIEPGKLADLEMPDKNPLDNIRNPESLRYVVKAGEVYETATLNRVGPSKREFEKFYWQE